MPASFIRLFRIIRLSLGCLELYCVVYLPSFILGGLQSSFDRFSLGDVISQNFGFSERHFFCTRRNFRDNLIDALSCERNLSRFHFFKKEGKKNQL